VVDAEVPVDMGPLGLFDVFWYLVIGLVFLAVPVGIFLYCGGRRWLRSWIRSDGKRKREGYQKVAADVEK